MTFPDNMLVLNGSGTDDDGIITKYAWQQISGSAGNVINQSNTAVININNLVG